jgi:hypothetical protein
VAAESMQRMRALPRATVGYLMAEAKMPSSYSSLEN